MSFLGPGRNSAYGPDRGPPPPRGPYGAVPGYGPAYPQHPAAYYPAYQQPQQPYWQSGGRLPALHVPGLAMPPSAYFSNTAHPTKYANTGQLPTGNPVIEPNVPSINMTNSTGGVGCEPGYNYVFHYSHTKIHVLLSGGDAPWNLTPNFAVDFYAVHVPTNTTIGDLMKGFGAVNPDPMQNKIFEVHPGGSGSWYKGMSFRGDNEEAMKKTLKEVGWDDSRNGQPDGKPVVWLYVVKS